MKVYGRYLVSGRLDYRGHPHGTEFVAALDANVESRAVNRGAIVLLERVTPALKPGSYRIQQSWLDE